MLNRGGYSQSVPEGVHQLKYMGGGHPGCGGYVEVLEVETIAGPRFAVQEYRSDCNVPQQYRWREFENGHDALDFFDGWKVLTENEGLTKWSDESFWEMVYAD